MVMYFWKPFLAYVFERGRGGDREANEEDIGLRVRERAQAVIVFLTRCIEEAQSVWFISNPASEWSANSCTLHICLCDK